MKGTEEGEVWERYGCRRDLYLEPKTSRTVVVRTYFVDLIIVVTQFCNCTYAKDFGRIGGCFVSCIS